MRGLSGAEFLVSDNRGQAIAHTDGLPSDLAPGGATTSAEPFRLGPAVAIGGERYLHTAIGVHDSGEEDGPLALHIYYPERMWRETRWQAVAPPLVVGAVTLVVVALVTVFLSR